jgi:hypothetical protein
MRAAVHGGGVRDPVGNGYRCDERAFGFGNRAGTRGQVRQSPFLRGFTARQRAGEVARDARVEQRSPEYIAAGYSRDGSRAARQEDRSGGVSETAEGMRADRRSSPSVPSVSRHLESGYCRFHAGVRAGCQDMAAQHHSRSVDPTTAEFLSSHATRPKRPRSRGPEARRRRLARREHP